MKYPIYAIKDVKVGFMQPIVDVNDSSAMRNFAQAVNNPDQGIMNFSPNDFALYKIGEFDNEKGTIKACVPDLVTDGAAVYGVSQI